MNWVVPDRAAQDFRKRAGKRDGILEQTRQWRGRGVAVAVIGVLTFLTVIYLFLRARYRASPLGEFAVESQREHVMSGAKLLQEQGFRIVDERLSHEVLSFWGARKFTSFLVADFLVEKNGVLYPAKVSSPRDPERVNGVWLRKQFLPLAHIYEAPVAYVQPEAGTIELVDFELERPVRTELKRWRGRLIWLAVGVMLGWLFSRVG